MLPTATHQRHTSRGFFDQSGMSSYFESVSGRSHSETYLGCIVSVIAPIPSHTPVSTRY